MSNRRNQIHHDLDRQRVNSKLEEYLKKIEPAT